MCEQGVLRLGWEFSHVCHGVPATQEAEAGGWHEPRSLKAAWIA